MAVPTFLKLADLDRESVGPVLEEYGDILGSDATRLLEAVVRADLADSFDFKFFDVSSGPPKDSGNAHMGKEIDVLSWSWGTTQSGNSDLSPEEIEALILSETDINVDVTTREAGDAPMDYIKITLTDMLVSSVSTGGSGGEDLIDLSGYDLFL